MQRTSLPPRSLSMSGFVASTHGSRLSPSTTKNFVTDGNSLGTQNEICILLSYASGGVRMTETSERTLSKRRVLVVDDEELIANTLAIILNNAGFEARAVFSGEQAVELIESFQPEMLITDVVMRGMTGIEAAIATRNKLPKCNILLFSGQAVTADLLQEARSQGHEFEILAKPVHPSELLAKLHVSNIFYS